MVTRRTDEERANSAMYALIRSALRKVWLRYPERSKALQNGRRAYIGTNKRQKWEHQCAGCQEWLMEKYIRVDHIKKVGRFLCKEDWATFGPNLFCDYTGLQKLCDPCHKIKSNRERSEDAEKRRNEKFSSSL